MINLISQPKVTARRVLRKIQLAISPEKLATFTLADGLRFTCKLSSSTGRMLTQGGIEETERNFVKQTLRSGDTFFDIGANYGLFTLMAAKKVGPTGRVFAFEPSIREAEVLERNVVQNNLSNVTIVRSALSDKAGSEKFAVARDGGLNSLAKTEHPEQIIQSWHTVSVTTLDEFVSKNSIPKIDVMKIDVEGAELKVLIGGRTVFGVPNAPTVLCEFCDMTAAGFQSSGRALYQAFAEYGYALYEIVSRESSISLRAAPSQEQYGIVSLVATKHPSHLA
jgi:FkbM family methyltransferase